MQNKDLLCNQVAVVLVNLGTPEEPTASALRRYLGEFLSDQRVVEIPRWIWWLILNGIILNTRPQKSAKKYASIWMKNEPEGDGSPLLIHTMRQAKLLQEVLDRRSVSATQKVRVEYAMRYGQPSMNSVLTQLHENGFDRLLIVPLYPQYSATTTASVNDALGDWLKGLRNQPETRLTRGYNLDSGYIFSLEQCVRAHWEKVGALPSGGRLLISFHGLPVRNIKLGDPYFDLCHQSASRLSEALGLEKTQYAVCFQSRFGRAKWLEPDTMTTLEKLGAEGAARVDVICPGFAVDCLETLEEIAIEGKAAFLDSGGQDFHYIPALNESEHWLEALGDLVCANLQPWVSDSK